MRLAVRLLSRLCLLAAALAILAVAPGPAMASHNQVAILQDDLQLYDNPDSTLQELRHLGVQMVRVYVRWSFVAPNPNSHRVPRFNASDPNAYPARNWAPLDAIVRGAAERGIQVMLVPTGFAPLWAQGQNPGHYGGKYDSYFAWEPSASRFGAFVHAVGTRYSGSFEPPGATLPLPRVAVWEIYNEPNFGEDLAPQAIDGSTVLHAPSMYRALADATWKALADTGHRQDTILIGSLAAAGAQLKAGPGRPQGLPGTYGETKPLSFVRELYCLDPHYVRYTGAAASVRGCPTSRAAYRSFRAQHPVLFNASGFSDHPYVLDKGRPPTQGSSSDPNYAQFNQLGRFAATLDRIQRIYGTGKRFPIWNTEYGYITCPPNCRHGYPSPSTAAYYLNWAEYLSWRNPRLVSTMQYLLVDPNPYVGSPEPGGFASGLMFYPTFHHGAAKPTLGAYELPVFLPSVRAGRGHALQVWGDVRPAPYAVADGDGPQSAEVQFAPRSGGAWTTIKTVSLTSARGYFLTSVSLPSSGSVRIVWDYPPLDPLLDPPGAQAAASSASSAATSRTVSVTIT
ncbi:MAG TPA: hypothetical protein VKR21_02610 [Solirubrobacteraceae bacterium]|nr:hypothetical protein [Solirubrobacteraceae bacterium]